MNQQQALDEIGTALGVLTHQVEQDNLAGMFSKNSLIEDLFLPVFSILYSAPQLRNLNVTGRNHAHLDLADATIRFGVQVTTDDSSTKITKTLQGVIDDDLAKDYDRILIFVLKAKRSNFTKATKAKWSGVCGSKLKFDPEEDVVALPSLLSKIRSLPFRDILKIRKIIAESVIGEDYVDVLSLVADVSEKHLSYERTTTRYIPGVFIEIRETKQLCRSFCHPALFLQRSIESAERVDLASWNRFLDRGGLTLLELPVLHSVPNGAGLSDIEKHARGLWLSYEPLLSPVKEYKSEGRRRHPLPNATPQQVAFYEVNSHVLSNEFQWIKDTVADIRQDFESSYKRVLLITGAAGQGKTNLLCDLYENFITKHDIPCAFLSGRELGLKGHQPLSEVLRDHLFGSKFATLQDGMAKLSSEAVRKNKPFILIIDGLNEHRDIGMFSQQLEMVVETLLVYPGVRFLFSCRTEFFDDRFSDLLKGVLKSQVMLYRSTASDMSDDATEELLSVYFEYFEVNGTRVAEEVRQHLTKDLLLLRFFCEGYGKRGKDSEYEQPDIRHFYRDELFALYLEQKLDKASKFLQTLTTTASVMSPRAQLQKVLRLCLAYMLHHGEFLGVPFDEISSQLQQALYALLDEELIIRKDRSTHAGAAAAESVNFTFDELRDFLISKFLIEEIYPNGLATFNETLERLSPQTSPIEGVQRFLFYASRKPHNEEFYEEFSKHKWYERVYVREVFNIDQKYLQNGDVLAIKHQLSKLDWKSAEVARSLAVRWNPGIWQILNLRLLNEAVLENGPEAYSSLIADGLGRSNFEHRPLSDQFCELAKEVANQLDFKLRFTEFRELVRLLIFLLPVHADSWWRSPALLALQALLPVAPEEVTEELLRFPTETFPAHARTVWRVLHEAMAIYRDDRILDRAQSALANLDNKDVWLRAELERFVKHFSGENNDHHGS